MNIKISLEEFRSIRKKLTEIIKNAETQFSANENNPDFDKEKFYEEFVEQYKEVQNKLLSYDLSDIPFEEWEEIVIYSHENYIADFSNTKANIDFNILEFGGYCNFKGCNIINLDKAINKIKPSDIDEETLKEHKSLFLSDIFSKEFIEKYYNKTLTIEDLASLTKEQLMELKDKITTTNLDDKRINIKLYNAIGIEKMATLYNYSKDDYLALEELTDSYISMGLFYNEEIISRLKKCDINQIKKTCYEYVRNQLFNSYTSLDVSKLPEKFKDENKDITLVNANISDEVKQRFFERELTIEDLINYQEIFINIPIKNFLYFEVSSIANEIEEKFGYGQFYKLVLSHPDVFRHIENRKRFYNFSKELEQNATDLEELFTKATKKYFLEFGMPSDFLTVTDEGQIYKIPEWLSSMNFQVKEKITTIEELMNYKSNVIILDDSQQKLIDTLGIENIKKLENEIGFFSHKASYYSKDLEMFKAFTSFLKMYNESRLLEQSIDFKNGTLEYQDFLKEFAKTLSYMKKCNIFTDYPNYDWIRGEFRNNNKEIFMDLDAPQGLKDAFYGNRITPEFLYYHNECIPYLINKDLSNTIRTDIKLEVPGLSKGNEFLISRYANFVDEYISRYGNEKLLNLLSKYGIALSNIQIRSFNNEIDNEQDIEQAIKEAIYKKIITENRDYSVLADIPELLSDYPELFIDLENVPNIFEAEKQRLTRAFYNRILTFQDVKRNPELIKILKDKDLNIAFGQKKYSRFNRFSDFSGLELLLVYEKEEFLELCSKYGRYLDQLTLDSDKIQIFKELKQGKNIPYIENIKEYISNMIEEAIIEKCYSGDLKYNLDAPDFLKEKCPDLFLDSNAPELLQIYFYNHKNGSPLNFIDLSKNKEWLTYLKNKSITAALLKTDDISYKKNMKKYLEIFGEEKAIKLGISRAETVMEMIKSNQVELMKKWYDKTGGKFIPDFVIMQNFSYDEADKFLISGSNWSSLMKNKSFAKTQEGRDAMLKLAYSFGVFDQDQRGLKKLQDLLTSLPRKINASKGYIINRIDEQIDIYSQRGLFFHNIAVIDADGTHRIESSNMTKEEKEEAYNKMIEYAKQNNFVDLFDTDTLVNLLETLKKEKVDIDFSKPIFAQLYKKNDDRSYSLTINSQSYPKSAQSIREILERFRELPIVTTDKAHQLFGGFVLKYDADFREFLLANMDNIMQNPEYVSLVASIQRQFSDIKTINSNRTLTWDLAVSYIQTNRFTSVNIGNERVAEVSSIAGYSQLDFDTLQKIYNYGKQRTFSSIPRIEKIAEKTSGKYTYETLRLDDPLAMAIGTLTDCCQELNNCAEACMQHSMVDKNGRVFIIKDEQGNIVAQSWVWRNKDVLCFDNIEIPNKAFARATKEHQELGRKGFTDDVFEIYKQAAYDLIEVDEKVYRELLKSGKITQEQYDGLRLGKITVGLGYNDIAVSLKENSTVDKGTVSRPLPYEAPVKLSRGLYTNDSITQYILEQREDRQEYEGETLPVHSDNYAEYNDSNFKERDLLFLEKLEIITKENPRYLETSISDYADRERIVTEIAKNYGLNPETTRIVMNPNFAIIYDVNENKLRISDLLFNTKVDNGEQQLDIEKSVVMQIRLALEQIAKEKEVDISKLNDKQQEMYAKAMGLIDELDIERGVGHAR